MVGKHRGKGHHKPPYGEWTRCTDLHAPHLAGRRVSQAQGSGGWKKHKVFFLSPFAHAPKVRIETN